MQYICFPTLDNLAFRRRRHKNFAFRRRRHKNSLCGCGFGRLRLPNPQPHKKNLAKSAAMRIQKNTKPDRNSKTFASNQRNYCWHRKAFFKSFSIIKKHSAFGKSQNGLSGSPVLLRRGGKKAARRQKVPCLLTAFINGCILGA